ncbi:hypothetical protein PYCCODRAFT_1424325 [Trametes coccinea BRFM310]|uniref:Uncharacterized protein n=1 Tax=Trametes coccinea (strain BRFM310) TaxID=1353009 RepID=A0A1Y2ITS2_TRAC3|nr:hypothetical protein PYCCODRAFT_1424325 [Trametes coccinea BRFM310]
MDLKASEKILHSFLRWLQACLMLTSKVTPAMVHRMDLPPRRQRSNSMGTSSGGPRSVNSPPTDLDCRGTSRQIMAKRKGSSKQLADQLAEFRLRIDKLKKLVNDNESDVEAMKEQMAHALADLEMLDEILCATGKRVSTVETNLAEMNERLNAMGERLEQALGAHLAGADTVALQKRERNNGKQHWIQDGSSEESSEESDSDLDDTLDARGGSQAGKDGQEKKQCKPHKERDNALHDTVRKCMYSMMGICPGGVLPEPVAQAGVNKKGWLLEVTQRIQHSGHKYSNALSREHLNALSHETITRAVKVVFHTMVKNWRMQADHNGEDAKKMRNLQAKINNCKRAKAKARYEMRVNVPEALDPMLAYQYQWQYQSTDESELEDVPPAVKFSIDPETDDEATCKPLAAGNKLTRKIWVSRAPAWRLSKVNHILDAIDVYVAKQRNEDRSGRGNTHCFRRRGEPRTAEQSQLPALKRSRDAIRIPRQMVDTVWLYGEYGEPYDNCRYISEDEGENEHEEDGNVGEREGGENERELGADDGGLGSERAEEDFMEHDNIGDERGNQAWEDSVWEGEENVTKEKGNGDNSDEELEYLDR